MNYIVSVDKNWGIGKNNSLLFSIPTDMKYFRKMTLGKTVVMGRKTLESFPGGKPLPKRENIVLTRDQDFKAEGVTVCHSINELFECLTDHPPEDIFVIGGAEIYQLLYKFCEFAYITKVDACAQADRFIENLDRLDNWTVIEQSEPVCENDLTYRFLTYKNSQVQKA